MSPPPGSPPPSRPPDGRARRLGRGPRVLAGTATGAAFLLIVVGALVRATGSGEGCPGWPRCFGRWTPPITHHPGVPLANALIEYSHRFVASVVFVLVVALALVAVARYRRVRAVLWPAVAALGLWVFQALLGGLVVRYGLTPWLVTAHLAAAMLFLGTLVVSTAGAFAVGGAPAAPDPPLARLAAGAAGSVLVLILVGGLVRGEGAGLAFLDWPLMGGRVVPDLSSLPSRLMFAHRVLALLVAGHLAVLAARAWGRRGVRPATSRLAMACAGLYLAQVLVGAANVWTRLAPPAVVAHVALAAAAWGAAVGAAAAGRWEVGAAGAGPAVAVRGPLGVGVAAATPGLGRGPHRGGRPSSPEGRARR